MHEIKRDGYRIQTRIENGEVTLNPELYLIKMAKNQHNGRSFLDYLRNDRMATAAAPLPPRAGPGAIVSMPLTWSQIRRISIQSASQLEPCRRSWRRRRPDRIIATDSARWSRLSSDWRSR